MEKRLSFFSFSLTNDKGPALFMLKMKITQTFQYKLTLQTNCSSEKSVNLTFRSLSGLDFAQINCGKYQVLQKATCTCNI